MAYPCATKLSYDLNTAVVLTDNNVFCLTGSFQGTMKLIDWLILAEGKESVLTNPKHSETVWKHAKIKAGIEVDNSEKYARDNLEHAAAMWARAYASEPCSSHY
jgi:hypothetical protein